MKIRASGVIAVVTLASVADAQIGVDAWSGDYTIKNQITMAYESKLYEMDKVLRISAIDPVSYSVYINLYGPNGHECDFSGIARIDRGRLVHVGKLEPFVVKGYTGTPDDAPAPTELRRCELTIVRDVDSAGAAILRVEDKSGDCKLSRCGARAWLNGQSWPVSARH